MIFFKQLYDLSSSFCPACLSLYSILQYQAEDCSNMAKCGERCAANDFVNSMSMSSSSSPSESGANGTNAMNKESMRLLEAWRVCAAHIGDGKG